jgi:hypothetical protein
MDDFSHISLRRYILRREIAELERQIRKTMPQGANYNTWHAYQTFQRQRLGVLRDELRSAESAQ